MSVDLPDSGAVELLYWLLRLRQRVGVSGASMIPQLKPGDEVLVNPRAYRTQTPYVGDIIVAHRPDRLGVTMIKRVSSVLEDGRLFLIGDNPDASTDSRSFGPVPRGFIVGKVTSKFG